MPLSSARRVAAPFLEKRATVNEADGFVVRKVLVHPIVQEAPPLRRILSPKSKRPEPCGPGPAQIGDSAPGPASTLTPATRLPAFLGSNVRKQPVHLPAIQRTEVNGLAFSMLVKLGFE